MHGTQNGRLLTSAMTLSFRSPIPVVRCVAQKSGLCGQCLLVQFSSPAQSSSPLPSCSSHCLRFSVKDGAATWVAVQRDASAKEQVALGRVLNPCHGL